jgi:hypothetical protein
MYYRKLNLSLPNINYAENTSHYLMTYGQKKLLTYYKLNELTANMVVDILPNSLKKHVTSVDWVFSGTQSPVIMPHIDNGVLTNINFYLETAEATTRFYEPITDGIPTPISDPNATYGNIGGKIFPWHTVRAVEDFKANPGDCYLLNVSKPHAVIGLAIPTQRKFVTVMFEKLDFNSVLTHFL